ncbi:glycosyltransferase family 1 protein [Sulfolobus sp. S-194]|uniref:glycosyltransferase family 4 protein n=1 Tax=Sulfolobus sp. S-194 TaxID=2512240 RepID=UPI0014372F56|nr:glycosyltransferase family 4 protein [Sulfolobus sp. S-194]QIW24019.1 glycosyltransferase family 1 protein [Sulfolobus sp. S-194]
MFSVAINTQTPPIRFRYTYRDLVDKYGFLSFPIDVSLLDPSDYYISVGGVAKMMLALSKKFSKTRWVSLGPGYPPEVKYKDLNIYFVDLNPKDLQGYTRFKEGIYNEAHGLSKYEIQPDDYIAYATYNWLSAQKLLEFYKDTDIYFINDFQQLLIGGIIGPSAPAVLWYHIPFVPEYLSHKMREFLIRTFEGFDGVIVSTKRDLEGMLRAGIKGRVKQVYPFIDPQEYRKVSRQEVEKVKEKYGIKGDDKIVTVVARMDPMKSQDVAIQAMKYVDNAKLLLVGNGSFTSGALGTGKANVWAKKLQTLAEQINVKDKVVFTGYVPDEELYAIYEASNVILLPSNIEGFGLTVCEGWVYGKPAIVSSGAGISELIIDGGNGFVFKRGDYQDLADKLNTVLRDPEKYSLGKETLRKCSVDSSYEYLKEIFIDVMKDYGKI